MEAKKQLARAIVSGFHPEHAVREADEDWARQFQRNEQPEHVEEVPIRAAEIGWDEAGKGIRLDKLLVRLALADSATDAVRKLKQGAVRIDGELISAPHLMVSALPRTLVLRVGKRVRGAQLRA